MSVKKVAALIRKNKSFLITTHTNAEGDALGSILALARLLQKIGKNSMAVLDDNIPYGYGFLPLINKIVKFKEAKRFQFDCFVTLDCSDLGRCGSVSSLNNAAKKPVINIDHHISNERFGKINWIDAHASSTAEMIYGLYKKMRVALDKEAALLLYIGIMTDSGSFRYSNTTSFTHRAAAELLKYGLNAAEIYKKINENIPLADARILSKILSTMRQELDGRIIWFQIKRNQLNKNKFSFDLSDEILGFARAIKGVEAAVLFKENLSAANEIRVNFRSQGKIDVNKIASYFGGGGHKTASGCTMKGSIDSVRKRVLRKVKASFK